MFLLFPFTSLNQPLFRLIDKNSQDNHRAHGNELPERINSQKDQAILDDGDNQRADHRADDSSLTTQERGATNNHRRDGGEEEWITHVRGSIAEAQSIEHTCQGCHERRTPMIQNAMQTPSNTPARQSLSAPPNAVR